MYYVYFLESLHHKEVYVGFTMDLKRRLNEHNQGKSIHTNKFKPWKVTCYVAFEDKVSAENFERYAKTGSGIAFARKHLL